MHFVHSIVTLRRPWVVLLLALAIAAAAFVPNVAAQGNESPTVSVIVEALNVRSGPWVNHPVIDVLLQGDQVAIIGRHTPTGWWQVRLEDGSTGWVTGKSTYVRVSGDTSSVPEADASAPTVATAAAGRGGAGTLVFQTASGGPIYAINADGTNLRYLTNGIDPALSPDGQQVAFTRWKDTQHGAFGSLWVINVDGSGERVIHENVRQPKAPVWSPAGSKIAISMQQGGRLGPESKCGRSIPSEPLLADEDGDYFRVAVEIDPDGDVEVKICYTLAPHPYWGLRMVDVATGQFEDLPRDLFSYAPTWDPVNDWHLIYDGELGLVNLDINRDATWPLNNDPRDQTPVFSPDGTRLAVVYHQHDHWDIHVMNADGSGRVRLTETPLRAIAEQSIAGQEPRSWNNVSPAWSPDGSQIAFLTDRTGQWEIWVMPAPGAAPQVQADRSNQRPLFPAGTLEGIELQYYNVRERALSWR